MTVLSQLHQDHVNLDKLLGLLASEVAKLKEGGQPDYNLLGDVVAYVSTYADGVHHPREDKMYAYFAGRDSALDSSMEACGEQHKALHKIGVTFRETVEGIVNDTMIPMSEFVSQLEAFVTAQRDHLNHEEGALFPKLAAIATEDDWSQVAELAPAPEDPLFGAKQASEYTALYKELILDLTAN